MAAFLHSFACAAKGFLAAVKEERNLRIHLCAAFYVVAFSFFYDFSRTQYAVLALVIIGVIALELVNSAFERVVDSLCPTPDKTAGIIKDIAAGAVLVFSAGAVACGVLLFWDPVAFAAIFRWFFARPLMLLALAASLALCAWFVFGFGRKKKED